MTFGVAARVFVLLCRAVAAALLDHSPPSLRIPTTDRLLSWPLQLRAPWFFMCSLRCWRYALDRREAIFARLAMLLALPIADRLVAAGMSV